EVQRYAAFMDEVVDMGVYKYQGTLKAEHGTGRNMAPFVKTEWGDEAYDIMKQIKAVVDPNNIFNRGVIINPDALVHLKNFKKYPVVEAEVDKCIECGFCEQSCPSKHVTLTPRKRIVIRRAQKRLREQGNTLAAAELDLYYQHDGIDTCAVDGMCASDCPVQINTGDLIKKLRKDQSEWHTRALAMFIAKNTKFSEAMARFGLKFIKKIRGIAHYMPLAKHIPDSVQLSRFAAPKTTEQGDFLIFTSCISRIITNQEIHDADYIAHIAQKTKLKVDILPLGSGLCCGQAFSSKGYERAAEVARKNVIDMLWKLTDQGRMPVIVDVSSCSQQFMNYHFDDPIYQEKYKKLKFLDSIDFIYEHILPKISVTKKLEKVTLHPNCSTHKMNKIGKYQKIAAAIAQEVHIPIYATCCGMAGDRGFIVPELTESAVAHQVAEVQLINAPYHCSTSVSCNINLSKQTGKQYESLYSLIHKIL
ncbi:MAG TPA: FAD-linked oxidase C-terminal domain-containing protein, partial [Cytophagales bacterium]|nr:FAD-linked oxidase C-terminal domain-containing protein [Cytophagales bacterium]